VGVSLEQQKQGLEVVEDKNQHKKMKVAPPSQITSFFLINISLHGVKNNGLGIPINACK
jgi:hypothetical protein